MREHLRSTMQLPVNMSNISELYSLMTVSSGLFDTKMLFQITLPLINDQSFDLFVVIPVPGIINGEYVTITPCTSMMAFNTHRNGYFPISEIQLAQCVSSKNDVFICSDTQEIYSLESGKCTCEVNLFNNSTSSCTWQSFTSNTLWIQAVAQNQWMFVARNPVKLNAVCDNEHSQVKLQNTGLLELPPGCILSHHTATITSHYTMTTRLKYSHTSFHSSPIVTAIPRQSSLKLKNISMETANDEITSLKSSLNMIRSQEELPNNTLSQHQHHFILEYMALGLSVLILCSIIGRYLFRRNTHRHRIGTPHPQPRRRVQEQHAMSEVEVAEED
ncbi:uncharacterized protein LOC119665641 [Teleopsis dalmanni]|uniref:uncharacterized protein LOC119665641 n=1 Tax=Teleopsis dalmanni TaxID=139649 RepID=UPI0018CE02DE|nr:uncharacterized protein LOC119665641 [Teleopsis dalmanni]